MPLNSSPGSLTHVLEHFVPLGLHRLDLVLQDLHLLLVLLLEYAHAALRLLQLLNKLLLQVDL